MFLFTTTASPPEIPTPPALVRPAPAPVVQAIRDGASATGVGFDYLLATARRESALDPSAKAPTSSATGLFQFIEQTWLGTMKNAGPQLGLQAEADAISRQSDGTYAVADPGQKQAILDLRRDPKVAAVLAGALTQKNAQALQAAMGHEPTPGDLYAAHVLGAKGAASLIGTAKTFPERAAALDLPEAAAANRALFYDRTGRPRTAAELYASLSAAAQGPRKGPRKAESRCGPVPPEGGEVPASATAYAMTATAFGGGSDLRSLFQTDRRVTATDAAAKLWQGRSSGTATARPAPSYFPRSDEGPSAAPGGDAGLGRSRGHPGDDGQPRGQAGAARPGPRPRAPAAPPPGGVRRGAPSQFPVRAPERPMIKKSMIIRQFLALTLNAPADRRAQGGAALARAYLYGDLDADALWEAKTALLSLLDDPAPSVRRALAEVCADSARSPRPIVVALSCDAFAVAEPILARSPVLTEADLVEAAALGDEDARAAIARRHHLTPAVSGALAEIADLPTLVALAGNRPPGSPGGGSCG